MANSNLGTTKLHHVASIPDRLQLIAKQIDASVHDPWTATEARKIIAPPPGVPWAPGGPSDTEEVAKVFWHTKNTIGYVQDPQGVDHYPTARRTAQMGAEDCDGHSIYICSMLHSLGFITGAKVVSPDDEAWHIYALAGMNTKFNPTQRIALDTTQKASTPGWEPPAVYQRYCYECTFSNGRAYWKKVR